MASSTVVGAFRVERVIGAGALGVVCEATQPSLGRTVALRLIAADELQTADQRDRFDDQQRRVAALHHPNLVPVYAAGEWQGGRFVASRYVRGARLSDLQEEGLALPPGALESVADALRAAHVAGLVHGRISAENILVEANGTAYLADLGLGHGGSPAADLQALAELVSDYEARAGSRRTSKPVRRIAVALAVATAIAVGVVVVARGGGEDPPSPAPAPNPPPKTVSVGSALPAVQTEPLGCTENPTPNTPSCTFALTRLDGTSIVVPRDGVVRGWAIRGASGDVSLQLIRERGDRSFIAGFSDPERISDPGPHAFTTDVSVGAGDRVGVGLGPGATIGSSGGQSGSEVARWDGRLTGDPRAPSEVIDGVELMVRADIAFKAR